MALFHLLVLNFPYALAAWVYLFVFTLVSFFWFSFFFFWGGGTPGRASGRVCSAGYDISTTPVLNDPCEAYPSLVREYIPAEADCMCRSALSPPRRPFGSFRGL
jgi:hypothetical protein